MGEWQHRNIHKHGDLLSCNASIAKNDRIINLLYRQNNFIYKNQILYLLFEEGENKTKAYKSHHQLINGYITNNISSSITLNLGIQFNRLQTTHSDNNKLFLLFSIPYKAHFEHIDDKLNPSHGYTFAYTLDPYIDLKHTNLKFFSQQATLSIYYPIINKYNIIGTFSTKLGSIAGAKKKDIPPPMRFYGGSENMLRGYSYLTVSPLAHDNKTPTGGRSYMIYSLEIHFPMIDQMSIGPFYEHGNIFANILPQLHKKLLQSYGIQMRYLTPMGPLTANIAFPINKRRNIDDSYQLYISIGKNW